uniref:TBC1 domain family member 30 n=1 Tax=Stomoxys calcitrans TaxID=35570 RepID=A0A1I8NND8_STOCA
MVCILHGYYDVHPKMRFSLTPPPPKALHTSTITTAAAATPRWTSNNTSNRNCSSSSSSSSSATATTTTPATTIKTNCDVVYQKQQQQYQTTANNNNYNHNGSSIDSTNCERYNKMQRQEDTTNSNKPNVAQTEEESTSDYKQWLHAMKLVARLPGGIPPEFRRKLWLSLADKYLKSKNVDWSKEEEKCFCEKWREDDEELGIQIVKDLHRTGSTLCTGPAGDVNQAKLKRILLGYARYNPEVGYCQGFNMLGALILQVMDKEETESMKVMIYLVEGILPPGYFCGSMGGLQADMGVFRELMQTKLPRLARHLQKLQGPVENAYEPPLTNVFTMQWFLTMFCTCLPMSCVLRVWDLVLIEGSDVLLRTALALWSLLEERVLSTRSADDFYGKMGSFSSELLNGHLIDSNGLIEKVVQLGPIQDIQKLRDKHLSTITPLKTKQGLNFYYDDDEPDMDEDSRLAVATVWGIPWGRRGSQGHSANVIAKQAAESKDRIALDISLLKKQYDRLRERQKQAHIILTTACSTARQSTGSSAAAAAALPVNQLLSGRPAIITSRGRRGPPIGAIPPARKPSLPAVLQDKPLERQLRRGETIQWRDSNLDPRRRRESLTWKEIRAERAAMISSGSIDGFKSQKIRTKRLGKSDSSSYSEESEDDDDDDKAASSSDTSLGDDDNAASKNVRKSKLVLMKQRKLGSTTMENGDRQRPKSWAPSNSEIPFMLMTTDSPNHSADESANKLGIPEAFNGEELAKEEENSATESDQMPLEIASDASKWQSTPYAPLGNEDFSTTSRSEPLLIETEPKSPASPSSCEVIQPTSTPPITDVTEILAISKVLSPPIKTNYNESTNSLGSGDDGDGEMPCAEKKSYGVSDEGVTNQYFERVNSSERPTKLELMYSLNEEDSIRDAYKDDNPSVDGHETEDQVIDDDNQSRRMDLLVDYSEKSSAACIAEAKTELSTNMQAHDSTQHAEQLPTYKSLAASKRRDPRRMTLTRSSTMEIEKRYQALEKRLSMEVSTKYKITSNDTHNDEEKYRCYQLSQLGVKETQEQEPKTACPVDQQQESATYDYRTPAPISTDNEHKNIEATSYNSNRVPLTTSQNENSTVTSKYHGYLPSLNSREEYQMPMSTTLSDNKRHDYAIKPNSDDAKEAYDPRPISSVISHSGGEDYRFKYRISEGEDKKPEPYRIYHAGHYEKKENGDEKPPLHCTTSNSKEEDSKSIPYRYTNPASSIEIDNGVDKYRKQIASENYRISSAIETETARDEDKHRISDSKEAESRREPYRIPPTGSSSEDLNIRTYQTYTDRDSEQFPSKTPKSEVEKYGTYNIQSIPRDFNDSDSKHEHYRVSTCRDEEISHSTHSPPQRKSIIPSTADLEERFENMIRDRCKQAAGVSDSEKGGNSRKTPASPKQSPRHESNRNTDKTAEQSSSNKNASKNSSRNTGPQDNVKSKGLPPESDGEAMDDAEPDQEDEEEISEAKAASDRSIGSTTTSRRQRKKEPPDAESDYSERDSEPPDDEEEAPVSNAENSEQEESEGSVTVSGHDSPEIDSEPEVPEEEEVEGEDEAEAEVEQEAVEEEDEPIIASRRQSELMSATSRRQSDLISEDMAYSRRQSALSSSFSRRQSHREDDEMSQKSAKISTGKKSPPSTEELEKRFEALEKQMSISKSEASEDLLEEPMAVAADVEFDDRQSPDGYSELDQQAMAEEEEEEEESQNAAGGESQTEEEHNEDTAQATKIKVNVIEAMKSSSNQHSDEEPESRSTKMATNVMEAMKSSKRRTDSMASNVMEAMRRGAADETDNRANRIKANVIEAMKSASALPSPVEDTSESRSSQMATNVREAMRKHHSDAHAEEVEKHKRANKIKADVIQAMKSSSALPSPIEDEETRSQHMAANVMKAMKSSTSRKPNEDATEKRNKSNRIKAGVIASMKSGGGEQPSPDEPTKSSKMASNVMEAMRASARPSPEDAEKRSRSEKIKGEIVKAMKSPSEHHSTLESAVHKTKMATNVMAAMKPSSASRRPTDKVAVEKQSRSDKIKAGIIASMKASPDEAPDTRKKSIPDTEAQDKRSRSDKIKAGIIASMKASPDEPPPATSGKKTLTEKEEVSKLSRSDKIKAGIIASMKSSSEQPAADESPTTPTAKEDTDKRRSDKIKAGIIASMKSSADHQSTEEPSRSSKMASNVMEAMKVSNRPAEQTEKLSRSDKIKAEVISAMKSSSEHHSPTEEETSRSKSSKMATNVMAAMKSSSKRADNKREEDEKTRRANKIKSDVIEAMKTASDPQSEETESHKSKRMATNVMDAMKSSKKTATATARKSPEEEKVRRANKIKADVIEAMKSGNQDSEDPKRSTKMATNVMEAMKSATTARRSTAESSRLKSTKTPATPVSSRPSPKDEAAEQKYVSPKLESLSSSSSRRSSEPPSTEDLEKRYEVLKRRMSSKNFETNKSARSNTAEGKDATAKTSPPSTDSLERRFERLQSESKMDEAKKSKEKAAVKSSATPTKTISEIPLAPEQPAESPPLNKTPSPEAGTRSALIEELQSKMGATPDGENIKPSSINPNRKTPPHPPPHPVLRKSNTDETSETHATNANSLSGKYEPIHSSSRKMVRRFSDLPSRADLENRLQFLEEQLSKTLLKQRRASDSEVASTSRNRQGRPMPANTSIGHVGKLESRVLELEKQLSASKKFRATLQEGKQSDSSSTQANAPHMGLEIRADSVDVTGKELVRYSHFGEVEEQGFQSPINISINIHMTLSKEELGKAATQHLSRADELSRRLLILEEQLKMSQKNIASSSLSPPTDSHEQIIAMVAEPSTSGAEQMVVAAEKAEKEIKPSESHKEEEEIAETKDTQEEEIPEPKEEASERPSASTLTPEGKEKETLEETSKPEEIFKSEAEPSSKTPTEVLQEIPGKNEAPKMPATQPREDDFDRRLQILEEHMKKSRPLSSSLETHIASKDKEETPTKPEKPKKDMEDIPREQTAKKIETPKEVERVKPEKDSGTSKAETLPVETQNKAETLPAEKLSKTEALPSEKLSKTEALPAEKLGVETLHGTQMVPVEVNKKTLVLLLDNEPKAVKVRRLTRANTEELEDLFQALEKQLIERGQVRPEDIGLKTGADTISTKEMANLTKEIMQLSKSAKSEGEEAEEKPSSSAKTKRKEEDDFDWGKDPIKHHLKKKTVYLPSTRELESRFRSLERQIKMLEDVEKIDVEQRLTEIEKKIKLQYSLSHEKDLNRFLDLCEGKGLDDTPVEMEDMPPAVPTSKEYPHGHHCGHAKRHQSPGRSTECSEHFEHGHTHCCDHGHHCTTPSALKKQHQSPVRTVEQPTRSSSKPTTEDLEYRFRALDLKKSSRPKQHHEPKREPIHPLEMLLDPSPEEIPTTGELEHRMRMLEEGRSTPSPSSRKSRSKSPSKTEKTSQRHESPSPSGLPTAQELEARLEALEKEQRFDFKMQKNYKEFNQKLKDIISPSLSFDEFKATRSSSAESAKRANVHRSPSPKVTVSCTGDATTCPKTIRFHEDEQQRCRETMKTIPDSHGGCCASASATVPAHLASSVQEGLGVMGIRLMRETSPLRRKGTHTGVPLRTGENINDQLTSIKNTIKSIDSLCEEKPYRTERCQQYIDSLCSDSTYFASKKSSYDDLRSSRHNSRSRSREYGGGPSIRISDQSPAFIRSMGSADSIRSSSPLRASSPLQYHSNRDLRRETSPRRRRNEEDREENESRVRRDNLLPNIYNAYNHSSLSQSSHSLTKFHKVDSQLISNDDVDVDVVDVELQQINRHATSAYSSSYHETRSIHDSNTNTSNNANNNNNSHHTTSRSTLSNVVPNTTMTTSDTTAYKGSSILDMPVSPYRQLGLSRSNTPVYSPAKLEIRHTTVTSTFYDRVLTEKQLEKKHSNGNGSNRSPANRSPLAELPPPVVIRPNEKYSPPMFPYPETAAVSTAVASGSPAASASAAAAEANTATTTVVGPK